MKKKNYIIHFPLLFCLLFFMIISILSIFSAGDYLSPSLGKLYLKQIFWYSLGFILLFCIIKIGNKRIKKWTWILYLIGNALLLLLLFIAKPINNSKCWFIIPGIGSFQPSEFMKIFLILIVSKIVSDEIKEKKKFTWKQETLLIGKVFFLFLLPTILTFLEPDTGVILLYFIICLSILFISPIRKRWFLISGGIVLCSIILFLYFYFEQQKAFVNLLGTDLFYRIDRLLDWKNGTGLQLENSLTAIGSSGLYGHGFHQTPLYFPEAGTDFIFSVFSSNFGLFGSYILLATLLFFDYTLLEIAKNTQSFIDRAIIVGGTSMLIYQQFQNISMTLGVLPITGITLPFISYGGSSLLSYMILLGIFFNIHNDTKRKRNT